MVTVARVFALLTGTAIVLNTLAAAVQPSSYPALRLQLAHWVFVSLRTPFEASASYLDGPRIAPAAAEGLRAADDDTLGRAPYRL